MFTNEIKGIIKMVLFAFVTAMTITGVIHCFTFSKAMETQRQKTIEEAVLVSSDENGYVLSFGGELHSYSFD